MRTAAVFCLVLTLAARADGPTTDLSGDWPSGSWNSDTSGHKGPLRATFTRVCDTQYRVVFRGRFALIVPFRYAVTLDVVGQRGDTVLLAGSSRLPLFGTFQYNAEATASEFRATFQSRNDSGTFTLRRCGCD